MSEELKALMTNVDLKRYAKYPPKKMLYKILKKIEWQHHYGRMRNWEWLVELLAKWLVLNEDITLSKIGPLKSFEGLSLKQDKLYRELKPLLKRYVIAAKHQPWDHLGELYTELGLVGPGQNMTPRAVVDMMIKMTYAKEFPPKKLTTQLDPCTGTGRFLWEASLLMPKAPLVLFGIEINLSLYRACLVNMAMFSNHPYSIICADALRLGVVGPTSLVWDLGNRWDPPDLSRFYWKPPPIRSDHFSLKAFTKKTK